MEQVGSESYEAERFEREFKHSKFEYMKILDFVLLVNSYTCKLVNNESIKELWYKLEDEIFIYEYNKEEKQIDLCSLCENINCDEDIEENKYALCYAISKYFNTYKTDFESVDSYILKMRNNATKRDKISVK